MNAVTVPASAPADIPKARFDFIPLLLLAGVMLVALPAMGSPSTWITLTVAGLAMGMIIFIVASGLTLVFGLMDVLNFGHGVFIALGAYIAVSVMAGMGDWSTAESVARNLGVVGLALAAAFVAAGLLGWAFERVIVRPVYGLHLKQILITMGCRSRCRCRRSCAARSSSATRWSRSTACSQWPSARWSSSCCCGCSPGPRSAC
jgi:branched-chain amino acid transport system permease protein